MRKTQSKNFICVYFYSMAGEIYLFGGKERRRFASLGDSDFHARFLTTSTGLWQAPDVHAGNRPWISPFVFCSANPIRRIDPTGMDDFQSDWAKKHGVTISFYPTNEDYAREYAREKFEQAKLEIEARSIRSSISIPRPVNEEKFTQEEKEAIASNAIATGTSLPEVITKEAGKRITKQSGDKAIIALGGREYYKLLRSLRIFGPIGCYFSLKSTHKTWDDYHEAGGNDWRVNLKLTADAISAFAGLNTDPRVFVIVMLYSIGDYASDGIGTDSIIENQINQYNEQQYNN